MSVGNVQYLQAEYDEATRPIGARWRCWSPGMDSQGAAFARSGLARVFAAQGDLAAALDMYGQVLADARTSWRRWIRARRPTVAPRSRASATCISASATPTRRARRSTRRAGSPTRDARHSPARLFGELGLTEIVAGRFEAALADYTESRARYEAAKNPEGVAHAWVGIGFSHAAREKFADAIPAYRTAIRMFEAQRSNESAGRAWLGLSLAQSGARRSSRGARERAEGPDHRRRSSRARTSPGAPTSASARRSASCRGSTRRGARSRTRSPPSTASPPTRRRTPTRAVSSKTAPAPGAAWHWRSRRRGTPRGALAAVEARRAHIRRVQLGGFQRDITRGTTADERAEEQGIVRELISTRAQLTAERIAGKPDAARLDTPAAAARDAHREARRSAVAPLRAAARSPPVARAATPAVRLDWLPSLDPLGALLVEYLVSDEDLLVVTIARGETGPDIAAALMPLKRRDLADKIEQAMQAAVLQDRRRVAQEGDAARTALLDPIAARLRDRDRHRDRARRCAVEAPVRGAAGAARGPLVARARDLCDVAGHAGRGARAVARARGAGSPCRRALPAPRRSRPRFARRWR